MFTRISSDGFPQAALPKLLQSQDIEGIAKYILSDQCKKISVLAGAGISVSAGIPDFRSKGGFYNTLDLSQYPLTSDQRIKCEHNSEYILTYELFKENPSVYLTARREMILAPTKYNATLSHWFLKLLYDKGLLKRYYSTNIDGLDHQISLPDDIICNVHGTLGKAHCIECGTFVDMRWFRNNIEQKKYPITCPEDNCKGYVKPNTVLFGQSLPARYSELVFDKKDLDDVDLFIVIGTSLTVMPSNCLPQQVNLQRCGRVLVNRDPVEQPCFEFSDDISNDVWLRGNADEKLRELTKSLGWYRELYALLPQPLKEKEKDLMDQKEDSTMDEDVKMTDMQQKEQQQNGRLIFVTGPSGSGKTTLGETLKMRNNFVHFDVDQFSYGQHPVNDSGKPIKSESLNNRSKALADAFDLAVKKGYHALFKGETPSLSVWISFYELVIKEIQKIRLIHRDRKTDIVITHSVYPRIVRDYMREMLGKELTFIVINTSSELLTNRILERDEKKGVKLGFKNLEEYVKSFGNEWTLDKYKKDVIARLNGFDVMQQDEPNTYQIDVDEKMTTNDVYVAAKKIVNIQ